MQVHGTGQAEEPAAGDGLSGGEGGPGMDHGPVTDAEIRGSPVGEGDVREDQV
jgi:hypothetical protein